MENIASAYPFGWSDLRALRLDELRFFAITATARRRAQTDAAAVLGSLLGR